MYHLPIYGQWTNFIFQMVTYNFFIDSVRVLFSECNGIKKLYPLITKFPRKKGKLEIRFILFS
jgi:hypothetical protein